MESGDEGDLQQYVFVISAWFSVTVWIGSVSDRFEPGAEIFSELDLGLCQPARVDEVEYLRHLCGLLTIEDVNWNKEYRDMNGCGGTYQELHFGILDSAVMDAFENCAMGFVRFVISVSCFCA